jgi:hypothetical protein
MTSRAHGVPSSRELARYLEREVTASEAAALEAVLADSAEARRRHDELARIRDALGSPVSQIGELDLAARVLLAIEQPPARRRRTARFASWPLVALAAGLVVGVGLLARESREASEFRQKSAASPAGTASRFAGVVAHHVTAGGVTERLGAKLPARDGLVFSYTNLGPNPFGYLMIFGIDESGEVRWYHPAYDTLGTNPASIPIEAGVASASLGALVVHELAPGPFRLHALFTRQPLHVVELEALLRHGGEKALDALRDASDQIILTQVTP